MSKNFTTEEIEWMENDDQQIVLHNGIDPGGKPRYDDYAFDAKSVNDKGIPKEEKREANDGNCGGFWRKQPDAPVLKTRSLEPIQLFDILNSNFERIFKNCFTKQNVSSIVSYINGRSRKFKLPNTKKVPLCYDNNDEVANLFLFSIDTGTNRVELNIKDWLNLNLYLTISSLDLDMSERFSSNPVKLLCGLNNLTDPSLERDITIKVTFKETTSAVLYFDKINIPDGKLLAKLKYHQTFGSTLTDGPKNAPGMQRALDVKSSKLPPLKMPPDYRPSSKKEAIEYVRNNLVKILENNTLTWNNFFKLFQNNVVPHDNNRIIQNKIKIANLLQDTINQIQGNFTVIPKCDNDDKVCKFTGYCYKFTDAKIQNECYLSSISIAQSAVINNSMNQSTITINFAQPAQDFQDNQIEELFTDSGNRAMTKPYNLTPTQQENSSDANTYSEIMLEPIFVAQVITPTDKDSNPKYWIDSIGWVREWTKFDGNPPFYVPNLNTSGGLEQNVPNSVYLQSKDYTPNIELDPHDKTKKLIIIKD